MILGVSTVILAVTTFLVMYTVSLRRVVPTNEVHIIQRAGKTVSYGKDATDKVGNTYYEFPTWVPVLGVSKTRLPISVFTLDLEGYEGYDKDRLPFKVDVKAFFRINDSNLAASRVFSFKQLEEQLEGIVQGAVRSILAKENLESIMSERSVYGDKFTQEVSEQLKEWGVQTVKNIELMDIRDANDSCVIANIMKKKKSQIEMESRVTVANNIQQAQEAEIFASQEVVLKQQDAEKQVGLRKAIVSKEVGIANQQAQQQIQEQTKLTTEKEMQVEKVKQVQNAEITKEANIVQAEANKQVAILNAEANKEQTQLRAEADLVMATKTAEGVKAKGLANAEAEKQLQLASVEAQTKLAKEIGANKQYQDYLVTIKQIETMGDVGKEQAKNLGNAEVKIFATGNSVVDGISQAQGMLSPKTGLDLGSLIEAFTATPTGKNASKVLGDLAKTVVNKVKED